MNKKNKDSEEASKVTNLIYLNVKDIKFKTNAR